MIEEGFLVLLNADAGVTGLLAGGGKITPLILPKESLLPAVTYQRISGTEDNNLVASKTGGLVRARYQFSSWSYTYLGAILLGHAIKNALRGFQGTMADADHTQVRDVVVDNDMDAWEDVARQYRRMTDFIFWYIQT